MKSSTIIGGTGAHERHPSDFYETPYEVTIALMDQLDLPEKTLFWEPACGAGAISRPLIDRGHFVYQSDIREDADGDTLDFLDGLRAECDWIITNPPFNLSDEFIRRAWEIEVPFAFLLKATFWNTKAHGNLFQNCPPTGVYPLTWRPSMAPDRGSSPTMDFTWCVWRYKTEFKPLMRVTA